MSLPGAARCLAGESAASSVVKSFRRIPAARGRGPQRRLSRRLRCPRVIYTQPASQPSGTPALMHHPGGTCARTGEEKGLWKTRLLISNSSFQI